LPSFSTFAVNIAHMPDVRTVRYSFMDSPVGPLLLAASERGLCCLHFYKNQLPKPGKNERWIESEEGLQVYKDELNAYFRGELREFTFELDLIGTPFQKRCWQALCDIPYGTTCSYADLARKVGSPRGFRAVGRANHTNPVAIVVPCHRVIGANGSLTGYGGGMDVKEKLLRLEGVSLQDALAFPSTSSAAASPAAMDEGAALPELR
jgi:methylated-DNA-[protein]-cysteine S-methyltransferase